MGDCKQGWGHHGPFEHALQSESARISDPFNRRYTGVLSTSRNQTVQVTSPTHWASVKVALIKSIRSGVLFDRKYWVRHLRTGHTLKPIYFSSIIMSDKAQKLNSCTSNCGYGFTTALSVLSGQIPQGSKHSHKRPRGGC